MQTVDHTRTRRRRGRWLALLAGAGLAAGSLTLAGPATAEPPDSDAITADVQDYLAGQLDQLDAATPTEVLVHGTDIAAARAAVSAFRPSPDHDLRQDRCCCRERYGRADSRSG